MLVLHNIPTLSSVWNCQFRLLALLHHLNPCRIALARRTRASHLLKARVFQVMFSKHILQALPDCFEYKDAFDLPEVLFRPRPYQSCCFR
eukprot:5970567-Amphidinium_carterae.1